MDQLDEIKSKIDIVSYICEFVQLKKTGRNYKGLCPFHSEKTPSFVVSPERQIWHCFGGCQIGGDVFKFLMHIENIEFPEALKILSKRTGVALKTYQSTQNSQLKERIYEINHLTCEYYNYILTSHKIGETARDYLSQRKITPDSIKLFKIGYAPNSWNSLIKFLSNKGYKLPDLQTAGLISTNDRGHNFDRFRGRVMFTLFDNRDNVVGFAGRLMDPNAKEAKYINTAQTPVYTKGNILYALNTTKDEIRKAKAAVVVEGEIDAIQSYQAGIRNIVAIKGSAFTENQVNLLKRYTQNVILSLDADLAGDAAAHRGILIADKAGLDIKVATFSEGKDPDELIKKNPRLWRDAVEKAVPFYDFIIDDAVKKHGNDTVGGKKEIVSEVAGFIDAIENLVVKNHYLKKLAVIIEIDEETLEVQLEKERRKQSLLEIKPRTLETPPPDSPQTRREKLETYVLALLLQSEDRNNLQKLIEKVTLPEDFSNPARAQIYENLLSSKLPAIDFLKTLPEEITPLADRLFLMEIESLEIEKIPGELLKSALDIKELSLREKLQSLSSKLRHTEEGNLTSQFDQLSEKLSELLKQRDGKLENS